MAAARGTAGGNRPAGGDQRTATAPRKPQPRTSAAMMKRLRATLGRQIERVEAHFAEDIVVDEKGARTLATLTRTLEALIDLEDAARRARDDSKAAGRRDDERCDDAFLDDLARRLCAMAGSGGAAVDPGADRG